MGEVDLGCDALRTARTRPGTSVIACPRGKLPANSFGFILFERAGVGLARSQTKLRQYVKNLAALDF
jgi:hypothetical protein